VYVPADPFHGFENMPDEKNVQQNQKEAVETDQDQNQTVYSQYAGSFRPVPEQAGKKLPK
jgi:hypothetical protein